MTSSRPSAFRRFCAAVVAAALVLQPLGAYAARSRPAPGRDSAAGPEPGQAEHHVHDGRLGQHGVGYAARLRRRGARADTTGDARIAAARRSHSRWCLGTAGAASSARYEPADSRAAISIASITTPRLPTSPARGPTAPTFPARAPIPADAGSVDRRLHRRLRRLSRCQHQRDDQSRRPAIRTRSFCSTRRAPTAGGPGHGGDRWLGLPVQRRHLRILAITESRRIHSVDRPRGGARATTTPT